MKTKRLIIYLLIGLLLRIVLAIFTEQRYDDYMYRFLASVFAVYKMNPFMYGEHSANYPSTLVYAYPPVWLYVSSISLLAWVKISGFIFPTDVSELYTSGIVANNFYESYRSFVPSSLPLLDLLMKLPNIIADLGIAVILYKMISPYKKVDNSLAIFWIFNPFIIQISTIWGEFDPLVTLFSLCSIYFIQKNKLKTSAIFLALGFGTKLYPIFFLIPILIYLYKKQKNWIGFLSTFALTTSLIFSIYILYSDGLNILYKLMVERGSPDWYGNNELKGLSWLMFLQNFHLQGNIPIFPVLFGTGYLIIIYKLFRGKRNFDTLIKYITFIIILIYLSYTVVNEQYLYWILPFLLYLSLVGYISKVIYVLISTIGLIFAYGHYNPIQFISPVFVWNEGDLYPFSDFISRWWPIIFTYQTMTYLAYLFAILCIISLIILSISKGDNDNKINSKVNN